VKIIRKKAKIARQRFGEFGEIIETVGVGPMFTTHRTDGIKRCLGGQDLWKMITARTTEARRREI